MPGEAGVAPSASGVGQGTTHAVGQNKGRLGPQAGRSIAQVPVPVPAPTPIPLPLPTPQQVGDLLDTIFRVVDVGWDGLENALDHVTEKLDDIAIPKPRSARYTIMDGVRRAKAAELLGRNTARAYDLSSKQTISLPIDALLSPKPVISTEGAGLDRWLNALRDVRADTYPPIQVQPGNYGIPLRAVVVQ